MNALVSPEINQRMAFLPVTQLRIDPRYQRPLSEARIRRMVATWSEAKADSITVSVRSGGFIVIDGQHRLVAARRRGIHGLWALIHDHLTEDDEAALFVALNTERARPRALHLFRSRLLYDPSAQAINDAVERAGWHIQFNNQTISLSQRTIAVVALEQLYAIGGAGLIQDTLQVINEAWPNDPRQGKADTLAAIGRFLGFYQSHPNYKRPRLVAKLSAYSLLTFLQRVQAMATLSGTRKRAVIDTTFEAYNKGLQGYRLPDLTTSERIAISRRKTGWEGE